MVILDVPSPEHLAYRPGVPLIAATVQAGVAHVFAPGLTVG